MHKPRFLEINIPHPCTQSWDEMTPDGQGRHCAHCQKTVIDFTTWSDAALYKFFSSAKGHVCGQFLSTQLERPIAIPHQPHSRLYRMTVAMGLTLLFTQTPHLLAQTRPPQTQTTSVPAAGYEARNTTGVLQGRVFDERKEPLISATAQVYQNGILKGGDVSDYDGNFTIKPLEPGSYDIVIAYPGYDSIKEIVTVLSGQVTARDYFAKYKVADLQVYIKKGGADWSGNSTWRRRLSSNELGAKENIDKVTVIENKKDCEINLKPDAATPQQINMPTLVPPQTEIPGNKIMDRSQVDHMPH